MTHYIQTRDELRAIASDRTLVVTRELTRSPFTNAYAMWPEVVKRAARDKRALDTQRALR